MDTFGPLQVLDLKAIQPTPQHRQKFENMLPPKSSQIPRFIMVYHHVPPLRLQNCCVFAPILRPPQILHGTKVVVQAFPLLDLHRE